MLDWCLMVIFGVENEINYDLCLVEKGEDPEEINFAFADFWVQVHDLCLGLASKGLAKSLGNTMGMFLDYDALECQII
ncbi:hypothetical protein Goklo_023043 [Gossypium klotzschianum]|uniref:DUF4283 domain-containing protein n=1 Tax=Gossypium klotzschianum TaxID=34286 RepID=A0A7J8TPK7_9ROSI|nr:hypothetical protein [Gossypium klotzschianum]